jgi:predicted esterase
MKHYKEGKNHIFEFGEMSITSIKLKQSQYNELAEYFTQQQIKNFNIPDVEGQSEQLTEFTTWLADNYGIEIHDMILRDYMYYGG